MICANNSAGGNTKAPLPTSNPQMKGTAPPQSTLNPAVISMATQAPSASTAMDNLFLSNPLAEHLISKMFTYMFLQCTAPKDSISKMACQFLSGVSYFKDCVIYQYFYLLREQRQYLFLIASAITRETECSQQYKFCNDCLILIDYTGKTINGSEPMQNNRRSFSVISFKTL
jgi:hypothetical protein